MRRTPYLLVIGDKEVATQTVAVRTREGKDLGSLAIDAFAELLNEDVQRRGRVV